MRVDDFDGFADLLRRHRGAAGLTQEELAERSGLSPDAISMLERGVRTSPRATTVDLLARALELGPEEQEALVAAARRRPTRLVAPPELRPPPTTFVGRERELACVRAALADPAVRVLALTGPPGVGKTRLAVEAAAALAASYRAGAVAVALAPLRDPGLVVPAIRQGLGLDESSSQTPLDTVVRHCRARHLLLLLDNFEHLLPAAADVLELVARCPGVQALVTSRASPRVRGVREEVLAPLALPAADQEPGHEPETLRGVASVRLFLERVAADDPSFELTGSSARPVAAICRRLDGLPLALELAAPWVRLMGAAELARRLEHPLELLVDGPRDLPDRQRTLRATLDWSCRLLDPGARALLRRLSVFAGSAPLEGLERVCGATGGVLPHLAALSAHSLVQQRVAGGEARVALLESVCEYGRERLVEAGELKSAARAHLAYYVELAVRAHAEFRTAAQAQWLERLRRERDNVRAALRWALESGDVERGLRLAAALCPFWDYGGLRGEGLEWLERLLALPGPVDPTTRAEAMMMAGYLAGLVGSYELAVGRLREALATFRGRGDLHLVAQAQLSLGLLMESVGDHAESVPLLEEAASLLRAADDRERAASALMNLGVAVARRGDRERATSLFNEALQIRRDLDDALGTALCLANLGDAAREAGRFGSAQQYLEESLAISRRMDVPYHAAAALAHLGDLARSRGEPAAAAGHYRESLTLFARIGHRPGVAICLRSLAWVAHEDGRSVAAARLRGAAEALAPLPSVGDWTELRAELGDDGFAAAQEAGGRLSMDAAVEEALAAV